MLRKMENRKTGELPNILNISDDYTFATYYHKFVDNGNYIFQIKQEVDMVMTRITFLNKVLQKPRPNSKTKFVKI